MTQKTLTCFKACDIRGEINVNIDEDVTYRIGCAVAQHFQEGPVVVGFDARETSPSFADAVVLGVYDAGSDVITIGMAGTEEMYWAVTEFSASAGIEVTASHNPINYNGMKIVKSGSRPIDYANDFQVTKALARLADLGATIDSIPVYPDSDHTFLNSIFNLLLPKIMLRLRILIGSMVRIWGLPSTKILLGVSFLMRQVNLYPANMWLVFEELLSDMKCRL